MCLVFEWSLGFSARQIADWLSSYILTGSLELIFQIINNCLSQTASCAAAESATYLASAVDKATQVCFWCTPRN